MTLLCFILFLAVAVLWFLSNEYPTVFGVYLPTCVLRRVPFKIVVSLTLVTAVFISGHCGDAGRIFSLYGVADLDCQSYLTIVLSSLIILLILKVTGVRGSAVYALIGGFEACLIAVGGDAEGFPFFSILVAPAAALLLSCIFSLMFRWIFSRPHIHLLTLSYYMRYAVMFSLVLTAFALGINYGGFLVGASSLILGNDCSPVIVAAVLAAGAVLMSPFTREMSDENAGEYSDFSVYTVLSVGISTAAVLLFFSFDSTAGLLSLKAVPLSVSSLVYASIAGSEIAGRRNMIETELHLKESAAMILTPAGSLLIAYLILYLTGNSDDNLVDFTVMSAAVIVLIALVFVGYAVRQRRQKEVTDRLVYSQQQQIYENSRALKDMHLKVVLSENQALHDAIEMKRQEVMNVALSIMEQKEYLESLNDIVKRLSKSKDEKERGELINELGSSLKQRLSFDRDVDTAYFYAQAESLHEDFSAKLAENFPDLTQQEKRLATLLRLGFSSKYIATLMNITVKSVEISRYRLRQKLGLSKGDNLVNFIKSI